MCEPGRVVKWVMDGNLLLTVERDVRGVKHQRVWG